MVTERLNAFDGPRKQKSEGLTRTDYLDLPGKFDGIKEKLVYAIGAMNDSPSTNSAKDAVIELAHYIDVMRRVLGDIDYLFTDHRIALDGLLYMLAHMEETPIRAMQIHVMLDIIAGHYNKGYSVMGDVVNG
jgi:hypothetical protein